MLQNKQKLAINKSENSTRHNGKKYLCVPPTHLYCKRDLFCKQN